MFEEWVKEDKRRSRDLEETLGRGPGQQSWWPCQAGKRQREEGRDGMCLQRIVERTDFGLVA